MALVQKAFSDIITFSRSSNATRVGPTGLVEYAPHNLLTYSEQFDNAAWTQSFLTENITANSATSPSGQVTADTIADSVTTAEFAVGQTVSVTANVPNTFSVFAKANGSNFLYLRYYGSIEQYYYTVIFDLSLGTATKSQIGSSASNGSNTITSVGNGWYRLTVTATVNSGTLVPIVGIAASGTDTIGTFGNISVNGTGNRSCFIWGAQLAVGPYALDYTPTTTAAVYGPRFDYDPVTLAARGLLVEEQRTNLCLYSEQFDNAAWNSAPVSVNSTVAPDGTTTAESFTSSNYFYQQISYASNNTVTFSMFAKGAGTLRSQLSDNSTGEIRCDFNLTAGTAATPVATGSWTSPSASITALSNGWYRCSITATKGAGSSILIQPTPVAGQALWGAQLETGSFATSYIPTIASTVTRSEDVASVNTLSPWWNNSEGSFYFEGDVALANGKYPGLYKTGTTNGQRVGQFMNPGTTSATSSFYRISDFVTSGSISNQAIFKLASGYSGSDVATALNGGAAVTASASGSLTLPTILYLGFFDEYMSGHIRRLAYYPRRLSNAELAALSA